MRYFVVRGPENSNPLRYLTFLCGVADEKVESFTPKRAQNEQKQYLGFFCHAKNSNPSYFSGERERGDEKVEPFTPERAQNEQKQYLDLFSHAKEGQGGKERKAISGASLGRLV